MGNTIYFIFVLHFVSLVKLMSKREREIRSNLPKVVVGVELNGFWAPKAEAWGAEVERA